MKRRLRLLLATMGAVAVAATGPATAQSPSPDVQSNSYCVTVSQDPAIDFSADPSGLTEAVADGSVHLVAVNPPGSCNAQVVPGPVEGVTDLPIPIEVVETAIFRSPSKWSFYDTGYALILRNPNTSGWVASDMEIIIDFFDARGDVVDTVETYMTLLPGQTVAEVDGLDDNRQAKRIEVTVSNADDSWFEVDYETGDITFSRVKSRTGEYETTTTGTAQSSFTERLEDISVTSIYRNGAGRIVGGSSGDIPFIGEDATRTFKTETSGRVARIAKTEVFWSAYFGG